jgi:hypothetical protein
MSGWWWMHKDKGLSNIIIKIKIQPKGNGLTSTLILFVLKPKIL